jgi:hypothetical protein
VEGLTAWGGGYPESERPGALDGTRKTVHVLLEIGFLLGNPHRRDSTVLGFHSPATARGSKKGTLLFNEIGDDDQREPAAEGTATSGNAK